MLALPLIPRSVLLLHPILLVLSMGGSRFAYRAWKDRSLYGRMMGEGEPMLVLGSGDAAGRLIREFAHSPDWAIVGMLTADPSRVGHELHGAKILGVIDDLPKWASHLSVRHAIVAMPAASVVRASPCDGGCGSSRAVGAHRSES